MIVLAFLASLAVAGGVAYRRGLAGLRDRQLLLSISVQVASGVLFWGWALRFPLVPREVYLWFALSVLQSNLLLASDGLILRQWPEVLYKWAIAVPSGLYTFLAWTSLPLLPFCVIWNLLTPLPSLAPVLTRLLMQRAIPGALFALAAAAALQSMWLRPSTVGDAVVSMLHRRSLFTSAPSPLRRVAAGKRRADAQYVTAALLSDPSLGAFTPPPAVRVLAQALADRPPDQAPDFVFLTGGFLSLDFALRSSEAAVKAAVRHALGPLGGFAGNGRVIASLSDRDRGLPPNVLRWVVEALEELGVKVLAGKGVLQYKRVSRHCKVVVSAVGKDAEGRAEVVPDPGNEAGTLRILLAGDSFAFESAADDGAYHVCLAGGYLGGLIGWPPVSAGRVLDRIWKRTVPLHGLWGKGPARLFVSPGVGSALLAPPFPPMRVGIPAAVHIVHIEVPER
ncbi:Phosphodiesterase YaeI [Diplonema papillatum]|nr:Phosphodiesterase YaeI [Diplonema papillatum]